MQTPILTKKWNSCLISIFNWKEIIYSVLNGLFHSTGKDRFSGHRFSGFGQFSGQIVRKNDYIRGKFATFSHRFWGHTRFRAQKGSDRFSAKPVVDCSMCIRIGRVAQRMKVWRCQTIGNGGIIPMLTHDKWVQCNILFLFLRNSTR